MYKTLVMLPGYVYNVIISMYPLPLKIDTN